jgi:hypothetical protein
MILPHPSLGRALPNLAKTGRFRMLFSRGDGKVMGLVGNATIKRKLAEL